MSVRETRASLLRAGGPVSPALGKRPQSVLKVVKEAELGDDSGRHMGSHVPRRSPSALPKSLATPTIVSENIVGIKKLC
jgi:hypothetical protein